MKALKRTLRSWSRLTRDVLFPPAPVADETADTARITGDALWAQLISAFGVVVEDAEVVEVGCGDGRFLKLLLEQGEARSAIGLETAPLWLGPEGQPAWAWSQWGARLRLLEGAGQLRTLETQSCDLVVCRDLDGAFPIDDIEPGLARLYEILRPGGEMVVRAGCADGVGGSGYGFMTPTAWVMLAMRAGFEVGGVHAVWRDAADQGPVASALRWTEESEALAGGVAMHLIRPWEADDFAALKPRVRRSR